MANVITPNMSLTEPGVGTEQGPQWALDLNQNFVTLDTHDHSSGKGVLITPAGLSITSDLPFGSNNATLLRSVRFVAQGSPLSGGSDLGCLYVAGVDLYYNDENGNQIRVTQSGSVVGTPGSITGLTPPASASYSAISQTFVFQSAVNTPANIDGGSIILRDILANSNGITLAPPGSLAANYTLTFPGALPGSTSFLTVNNSGTIAANISTTGGITGSNIASATVAGSNIVNNVSLSGAGILLGGSSPVTAGAGLGAQLVVLFARINGDGSIATLSPPGAISLIAHVTGSYSFQLSPSFYSGNNAVVIAQSYDEDTYTSAVVRTDDNDFEVNWKDAGGSAANNTFSIIAIGVKS